MTDSDDTARVLKNQSMSIARAAILLQCMQHFAVRIGRSVSLNGSEIDEDDIKNSVFHLLKDADFSGVTYEDQLAITQKAMFELDHMMSSVFREIRA